MTCTKWTILLLVAFFPILCLGGANDTGKVKKYRAVLVQLRAEQNRINATISAHKPNLTEKVMADGQAVRACMVNDFTDNFSYCKVYYYIDTNVDKIRNKDLVGVLLNADMTVATDLLIDGKGHDYLIVYYGTPVRQTGKEEVAGDDGAAATAGNNVKGLVILNDTLGQLGYYYKFDYMNGLVKTRKNKKYSYKSKTFEIEYFPCAKVLNDGLMKNDNKIKKGEL